MKKILPLILMISVMIIASAGCNRSPTGTISGDESSTSEFVKIEMWTGYPLGLPPKDLELVFEQVNEVLKEEINTELDIKLVDWMSIDSTLNLKINAADTFDICFTAPWANDYFKNVRREAFVDISELLPEYAPTIWETVPEEHWDSVKVDDKIYAVINNQIVGRQFCAAFRETTFNEYLKIPGAKGLKEITKVEDVTPFLAYAKSISEDGHINSTFDMDGIMTYWGFDTMGNWMIPGVVAYDDETFTVINQYDTPQWRDGMRLSKEWYDEGYYWPDMNISTTNFTKLHMRFPPTYKPGIETEEYQFTTYEAVFAKLGKPIVFSSNVQMTMNAISQTSKNPVRSLQLLEVLYKDKDLYNMIVFGLEDKHYKVLENLPNGSKRIELIEKSGYSMPIAWAFGNQFNQWLLPGQPEDIWEQTLEVNNNSTKAVTFGFTFDPTPIKTEYATCTAVVNEYWYNVLIGLGRTDEQVQKSYETFLLRLKQAGADTIIAEKQKQLNEWREANGK